MRWVQHAALRPHRCAVIPYVGNHNASKGFFDTGQHLAGWDPHVYISVQAVEHLAGYLGCRAPDLTIQAKLDAKDERIRELEEQLAEAQRFQEAAEYTMEKFGTKVRQRPGPKAKTAA